MGAKVHKAFKWLKNSGEDEGGTWQKTITCLSTLLMKESAALLSGRIPFSPSAFHEAGIV